MESYAYFDIVNNKELVDKLFSVIHNSSGFDGYNIHKRKDWSVLYLADFDFHLGIDEVMKEFFKKMFKTNLYVVEFPVRESHGNKELYRINSYQDFKQIWSYYSSDNNLRNYKEGDNEGFIFESFFFLHHLLFLMRVLNGYSIVLLMEVLMHSFIIQN